jgi:predicted Zn-dependent peptidase
MMPQVVETSLLRSGPLKEEIAAARIGGLRVFVLPKKGFRRKYAEIFVHYGSNDNAFVPPGGQKVEVPPGIAHFLEHKMFEKEWGAAFSEFARIGASVNAFTSNNYTSYLFWALSNWKEALEMLFEVAFTPHFTAESVEKEQNIIGQEIRMYDDDPGSRLMRDTLQALYLKHPVRLDLAGTQESIKKIDKDLLYLCHGTFYCPENMGLFVAGDLDPVSVFEASEKLVNRFGAACKGAPERVRPEEPPSVGEDAEVSLPVPVPMMQVAWKDAPPGDDGETLAENELGASVLLDILFGKSSEFFTKVYEEGLIDDLNASYEAWPDYAFASVAAQTTRPEELAARVQEEVERARKGGVSQEDFLRTRKAALGRYVTLFDSFDTVGEMQAHLDDIGLDVFSYGRVLEGLRVDDVNDSLKMLRRDRSVRVIVRDKNRRGR